MGCRSHPVRANSPSHPRRPLKIRHCGSAFEPSDTRSWDSLLGANQIQGCFWEAVLGVMDRLVLSEAAWERMAPLIMGRPDQKGSTGRDNRMFVEGVLWIVRTGSPWRDLPEDLAIGTACSGASVDGASRGFGGGSSRRCPMIRTLNI